MSVLPSFSLTHPTTLAEALEAISLDALPYVGGTELLMAMRMGLLHPAALVDLKRIPELRSISRENGSLSIGAAASHAETASHPLVRESAPLLPSMLQRVGNARVRAMGTLGGNLCFAEPKSDVASVLIALGAEVVLRSSSRERTLPVEEFLMGAYTTVREPQELLVRIRVPLQPARRGVYLKYQTMERPTLGVAAVAWEEDGQSRHRIVVGAVSERPVSFDGNGSDELSPDDIANAIEPIPDLTGSADYKRHVTAVFVRRALEQLRGAA